MRNKSSKLAKLERERISVLTNDLDHCYLCDRPKYHLHEVFFEKIDTRHLSQKDMSEGIYKIY